MRTTRFLLAAALFGAACTSDDAPTTESTAPQGARGEDSEDSGRRPAKRGRYPPPSS